MEITNVIARDLNDAWFQCLVQVMRYGREYTIDKGSYEGSRRKELDFIVVKITNPGIRPLHPDTPIGVPVPATDEDIQEYFLHYLMSEEVAELEQYTYGQDVTKQVFEIIERYNKYGHNTNQLCITVGSSESLWLEHSQCLRVIDTRVIDGVLNFVVYFRSWDLWAGFPTNLGGLQLLKEYMADEIGVEDGEIIACSKGLHLYDYAWELAKTITRT